jgi:RNA-splicing ligase RtcB
MINFVYNRSILQVVDEIFDEVAAARMGIDKIGWCIFVSAVL